MAHCPSTGSPLGGAEIDRWAERFGRLRICPAVVSHAATGAIYSALLCALLNQAARTSLYHGGDMVGSSLLGECKIPISPSGEFREVEF